MEAVRFINCGESREIDIVDLFLSDMENQEVNGRGERQISLSETKSHDKSRCNSST